MPKTWVQSLGQEDALEKRMATHSSMLAWRIPWTEKLGRVQSVGSKKLDRTKRLNTRTYTHHTVPPVQRHRCAGTSILARVQPTVWG